VPAHAGDLYASPTVAASNNTYLGSYIQGGIGIKAHESQIEDIALASKGYEVDLRLGHDWGVKGTRFILGVFSGVGTSDTSAAGFFDSSQPWHIDVGSRVGYRFDSGNLLYVLGAWQTADFKYSAGELGKVAKTLDGFKYGGGVEFALDDHFTLGLELTRIDYASFEVEGLKFRETDYNSALRLGYRF